MTEAPQAAPKAPKTFQDALKLWDASEDLQVFQVESTGATQEELWGAALEMLRDPAGDFDKEKFSTREISVIESIVHVARAESWTKMIARHIDPVHSPAISIRKPEEKDPSLPA
jgi:hypothetical protein